MLLQEIKNIRADRQTLRKFGITIFVILFALAAISFWKAGAAYRYLAPVAGLFLVGALLFPILLKGIYLPWMALATVLGWVMTRVILTILYYFVITPFALIVKVFGKDLLDERFEPHRKSYWVLRDNKVITKEELERQF